MLGGDSDQEDADEAYDGESGSESAGAELEDEPRYGKRKSRDEGERPSKRAAVSAALEAPINTIADEEELALKLLQNRF